MACPLLSRCGLVWLDLGLSAMGLFKAFFGKIDPKVFGINMVEIYIIYLIFYQGSGVRSLSQAGATAVSVYHKLWMSRLRSGAEKV